MNRTIGTQPCPCHGHDKNCPTCEGRGYHWPERTRAATVADLAAAMLVHLPMEGTDGRGGPMTIDCEAEGCRFTVQAERTAPTVSFVETEHAARVEFQRHVLKAAGVTNDALSTPVDNPVDRVLDAHLRGRLDDPGRGIPKVTVGGFMRSDWP